MHPEHTLENGEIEIQVQTTLNLVFLTTTLSRPGKVDELNLTPQGAVQNGMPQRKQHRRSYQKSPGGVAKEMENLGLESLFFMWRHSTLSSEIKEQIFPKVHEIPLYNFMSIHTHTSSLSAIPLKYTIGTFLITVVSWGNHVKCIRFYLRLTKAGGERGTLAFQ